MALEKQVIVGIVEILPDMSIQVREDTIIVENGKELSRSYHRSVLTPGDDVSTQSDLIKNLTTLLWTPEVIAAAQAKKAAELEKILASLPKTPVT